MCNVLQVLSLKALQIFREDELEHLLCGEQNSWTFEELVDHMKFDHGYTSASSPVISLLETIQEFECGQRRAFLQFVTGAPRLPPGGFAALNPKLTVVRKLSYRGYELHFHLAWVRTYALFLEERLKCFRVLKYDIEAERLVKTPQSSAKGHSRTRLLPCDDLLEQLPALQQLLFRLIGCQPEGAAYGNYLIQYALALVLKESFKIYCAINDGIINLVDMFFEMSRHDAIKAFNIYKKAGQQAETLSEFYEFCKGLELARNFQFPNLRQPPPSFLTTMEEYIKEAPRIGSVSNKTLEYKETLQLTYKQEEPPVEESKEPPPDPEPEEQAQEVEEPPQPTDETASQPLHATGDLLGLDEINPMAAELDESNALALAIIPNGDSSKRSASAGLETGVSGWELALVTAPSSNDNHVAESKLAGGFDRLLLDSLYEDATRRQHNFGGYATGPTPTAGPNPFGPQDPFTMSKGIAPPTGVQMAMVAQQQQQYHQQQMGMMVPYQPQYSHPPQYPQPMMGSTNPFGDPFVGFPQAAPSHGTPHLL